MKTANLMAKLREFMRVIEYERCMHGWTRGKQGGPPWQHTPYATLTLRWVKLAKHKTQVLQLQRDIQPNLNNYVKMLYARVTPIKNNIDVYTISNNFFNILESNVDLFTPNITI